jgi:hypothetical protein
VRHHLDAMDAARGAGGYSSVQLSLIVPRIVLLVVPKTSTTVWVLILLFGTPTATTTLLTTLATLLTTFLLTTLASLTSLLAALILTLILRHHYLPIGIFPRILWPVWVSLRKPARSSRPSPSAT